MNVRLFWHRLTHWEYWPLKVIYYPLFPVWLYFSFKARSFFFFNAANPSMRNGGMAMEPKMDIYNNIPSKYIPKTVFIDKKTSIHEVLDLVAHSSLTYPLIAKPDIGMKSFAVERIYDAKGIEHYLQKTPSDFLIQEFIPYEKEVGIFYVRYPGQQAGKITGIVGKEFLTVQGDGLRSIEELLKKEARGHLQLSVLKSQLGDSLENILPAGERKILVPYGSHTRGAKFIDLSHLKTPALETTINSICTKIDGFYYGRLDVLYQSFEELTEGKNFSIIEVNGAGSEATHIYDPSHSLFFAWREIVAHWNHLCKISIINHRKGHPYLSFSAGRRMLKEHDRLEAKLKVI